MAYFSFFIFLLINLVSAGSVSYHIVDKNVLVEISSENLSSIDYVIPYDVENLEKNETYLIYTTNSMIEKTSKGYFFIHRLKSTEPLEIYLYLPESAILKENGVVVPEGYETITNGQNIILHWKNYNGKQIIVDYMFVGQSKIIFYGIIMVLLFLLIVFYKQEKVFSIFKKISPVEKEKILKNLYEDEKKIINYLLEKKNYECWTKELVKNLGISKVKLSRKLRSLEQKGIVKKIPYGNENIVKLIKGS